MPERGLDADDPLERAAAAAAVGVRGETAPSVIERLTELVSRDPDPRVRAAALGALARAGADDAPVEEAWQAASGDLVPSVRRRAVELAPELAIETAPRLVELLSDADPLVAEAAAFALGELGDDALGAGAVDGLGVAARHDDPLVREAAVAALGSLGDPRGLPTVLAALDDRPPIRRRAVLALAAFEGEEVEAALRHALDDRDWQVRQAAEDLLAEP